MVSNTGKGKKKWKQKLSNNYANLIFNSNMTKHWENSVILLKHKLPKKY